MTPATLANVYDHPAVVLDTHAATLKALSYRDAFGSAANRLRTYEAEHGVVFAALDTATLDAVREAYANLHPQEEPRDTLHATEEFARTVRDLLGLDD